MDSRAQYGQWAAVLKSYELNASAYAVNIRNSQLTLAKACSVESASQTLMF